MSAGAGAYRFQGGGRTSVFATHHEVFLGSGSGREFFLCSSTSSLQPHSSTPNSSRSRKTGLARAMAVSGGCEGEGGGGGDERGWRRQVACVCHVGHSRVCLPANESISITHRDICQYAVLCFCLPEWGGIAWMEVSTPTAVPWVARTHADRQLVQTSAVSIDCLSVRPLVRSA